MLVGELSDSGIPLDYCRHCEGLWFDGKELKKTLRFLLIWNGHAICADNGRPERFRALLEFFRNSALNLTRSGSVPIWLTNLCRASHRPTLRVTLPEFIAYAPG